MVTGVKGFFTPKRRRARLLTVLAVLASAGLVTFGPAAPASAGGWTYIGKDYGIVDADVHACQTRVSGMFSTDMRFAVKVRATITSNKVSTYPGGNPPRLVAKQWMGSFHQYVGVKDVSATNRAGSSVVTSSTGGTVAFGKTVYLGLEYNYTSKEPSRSSHFTYPVQKLSAC